MDRGQQQETEAQAEIGRFLDDFVWSMETWPSRTADASPRAGTEPDAGVVDPLDGVGGR